MVLGVYEEDDTVHLREVVLPKTTCLLVSAEIVCSELDLTDGKLFRSCERRSAKKGDERRDGTTKPVVVVNVRMMVVRG